VLAKFASTKIRSIKKAPLLAVILSAKALKITALFLVPRPGAGLGVGNNLGC
jgi:hypothetical protein